MLTRYACPEMLAIWSSQRRFQIWFHIEAYACQALAEQDLIPKEAAQAIWDKLSKASFDPVRIDEIERHTKHDVIAFLTHASEFLGAESRFLHQGMTSSDVLDTCLNIQLKEASDLLLARIDKICQCLKERAYYYRKTVCVGRSHGIHAEPTSFGLKLAQAYAEFRRCYRRLEQAKTEISTCAISGPVGSFSTIPPFVEAFVAEKLGLRVEPISTQIIPRDRHAMFFATLAVIASSIERLAVEIRHLQRSEVGEAEEFFSEGQKGSSAMPHKRNPILSENITGLARMIRAYALPALENVAVWHERDISHSSVERFIGPDATITLDFALHRLHHILQQLQVFPEKMQENMDLLGGLIYSHQMLLALTQKGLSREEAYQHIQRNAQLAFHGKGAFLDLLKQDPHVTGVISPSELDALATPDHYLIYVDQIFNRVFEQDKDAL